MADGRVSPSALRSLSRRSAAAVREAVAAAALTNERALCVARVVFFAAVLIRFFAVGEVGTAARVITVAPLAGGIVFSLAVLWLARRPPTGEALWLASVTVDAVAVFCSLLPNALWPTVQYPGVLSAPDTAAVLLATTAAGLRLSPRAAVLGTALHCGGVVVLVMVDRWISGDRYATGVAMVSLYLLWIAGFGMVATILAWASRRLATRGATMAVQAERARQGLFSVLGDHHDLRSLLTSAVVRAEAIAQQPSEPSEDPPTNGMRKTAAQLNEDLALIRQVVDEVKTRALGSLEKPCENAGVPLAPAIERALDRSRSRFADVSFEHETQDGKAVAAVAGGEVALLRLLDNLLANAAEGDGHRHATTVAVRVTPTPEARQVRLDVEDDGPGLPSTPPSDDEPPQSTKRGGTGVGLAVVRGIAEASGGSLSVTNRPGGGVCARVSLPAA